MPMTLNPNVGDPRFIQHDGNLLKLKEKLTQSLQVEYRGSKHCETSLQTVGDGRQNNSRAS